MTKQNSDPVKDIKEIHAEFMAYPGGLLGFSKSIGLTRGALQWRFRRAGLPLKTCKQSICDFNKNASKEFQLARSIAAHNAIRGSKRTVADRKRRAVGIQKKQRLSIDEIILDQLLRYYGIKTAPLFAIGIYNIDIAIPDKMIAIEINGGGWHGTPKKIAQDTKKRKFLELNGWQVFTIWTQRHRFRRNQAVPIFEALGLDPTSPIYKDGVIRGEIRKSGIYNKKFSDIRTVVDFKNTPELAGISNNKIA